MEWGRFLRREEGEEGSSNKLWCLAYRGRGEQAGQNPKAAAGEWRVFRMWSATDFDRLTKGILWRAEGEACAPAAN